jgi:hypothetical protein
VISSWRHRVWPWVLLGHAALVVVLTLAFVLLSATTGPDEGANIGAGFLALPLQPLGLPWSIPFNADPYRFDGLSLPLWHVVAFGPAWLNVVLHGAVFGRAERRRRRHSS